MERTGGTDDGSRVKAVVGEIREGEDGLFDGGRLVAGVVGDTLPALGVDDTWTLDRVFGLKEPDSPG